MNKELNRIFNIMRTHKANADIAKREMEVNIPKCRYCRTGILMVIVFAENNDGLPNIKNPAYCPNCGRRLSE